MAQSARKRFHNRLLQSHIDTAQQRVTNNIKDTLSLLASGGALPDNKGARGMGYDDVHEFINKTRDAIGCLDTALKEYKDILPRQSTLEPSEYERHFEHFAHDWQLTFQQPPFYLKNHIPPERDPATYEPILKDAAWLLHVCALKRGTCPVRIHDKFAEKGTYLARLQEIHKNLDPKAHVPPTLDDGDRFNMMMCVASWVSQIDDIQRPAASKKRDAIELGAKD